MIKKIDNPLEYCDLKFASNKKGVFEGYASVFNGVDAVRDTILPGAFTETLKQGRNPAMFVNHNSFDVPVGDWINLEEDDKGLKVVGKIDLNHRDGLTVFSALERKAMDALSIGFRIPKGGAEENDDGSRIIKEIDLKEISVVNFPADDNARIAVVKADIFKITSLKDAELFLRESEKFTKATAQAFISHLKNISRSDSEEIFQTEIANLEKELQVNNATNHLLQFIKNM